MGSGFKLLLEHMRGCHRFQAIAGVIVVAIETSLELFIPVLMAGIIDHGVAARNEAFIIQQGLIMIALSLLALGLGLLYARFASRAAMGLATSLRRSVYAAIQQFDFENLDRYRTASLVTRMTTDITVIQNAFSTGFRPCVRGPVLLVMGLVYAMLINTELAVVFAIVLPVLAIALALIARRVAPLYRQLQEAVDSLNGVLREDLTAVRAVKAYVREEHQRGIFGQANEGLARVSTQTFGTAVLNLPLFQASMYVTAILVLLFGGSMVLEGRLGVGQLTGFMSYVLLIMTSLVMISNVFLLLMRALTSVHRVGDVLAERPILACPAHPITEVASGSVRFENVSFRYQATAEEDVLEQVSLDIPAGSWLGILGGTGSGKTSLVQLIPRLYDAASGRVLVGGHDVRDYDIACLRDAVGIVLQNNVLFTGTVRENLLWGNPEATDEELLHACKLACADEFLDRIGGLDGDLGQGGAGVSGGQRQRLCIARTLVKRPKILIFDDAMSALDMATDAQVRTNLASIEGVTLIVIAQRITSIMDADHVAVLDDGHLHALDTPARLLESDPIFREIHASQMEFCVSDDGSDSEASLADVKDGAVGAKRGAEGTHDAELAAQGIATGASSEALGLHDEVLGAQDAGLNTKESAEGAHAEALHVTSKTGGECRG
ncbi:ABC transporter ATP-binding protein/permease [Collinsella sp. AGMB00827]|uniref:ABC transporter ATP-binding protein/permease n=2 Tax=Collinsella ureilytica TaxID=2869515 RepID=A0ABS7MIS0_9ACTN|nr:ABC transporter ATP-binding protein/permease [Collinsella urealyticum]